MSDRNFDCLTAERMYEASYQKDKAFEGVFFMAVRTTGIFCRPSCTARKPKFENVSFYPTIKGALLAGYRPCKVCKPLTPIDTVPDAITNLLKLIQEQSDTRLKDDDLKQIGLVPATVRRWFKQHYGLTFQAYQRTLRIKRALGQIQHGDKISSVAYDNGFESLSGFHNSFKKVTGHSPNKIRSKK